MGLSFFALLSVLALHLQVLILGVENYSRPDFPADFVFGSGTSAYQYEGAAFEDGKSLSIWDTFAHSGIDHDNADVGCDGYHKYKEDVGLMFDTGLEAFRLSISWPRLIPNGRGPVNPKGLQFYNDLINELISHGIQPHVTLHHFDLPQALEDEYGGWLSREIVKDFTAYADVCFKEFGDRVLYWTPVNEANIFALGSYDQGITPPGRCSSGCDKGNSSIETYIVGHNILLAHSAVAKLYKKKYKATQHGYLGFNIYSSWLIPYTNTTKDIIATQRANDFYIGWLLDPLFFGDYPEVVKKNAKGRIPVFTEYELKQVKGSVDFIGINHYTYVFIRDNPSKLETDNRSFLADMAVDQIYDFGAVLPLPEHYPIRPSTLTQLLEYLKEVYGNPPVYVHENGEKGKRDGNLYDIYRKEYLQAYIWGMLDAMRKGSNTKGYFAWTFLDTIELLDGYKSAYGLYYVDLDDEEKKRYQKLSARWYKSFLKGRGISSSQPLKLPHPNGSEYI